MSDSIIKIIPKDPYITIPEQALIDAKQLLEARVACDSVSINTAPTPMFIDCGGNLEEIVCPNCGETIDFEWWSEAMDKAFEDSFISMEIIVPCCKSAVSLNDLEYRAPCGFACFSLEIFNPATDVREEVITSVQKLLRTELRIVKAYL